MDYKQKIVFVLCMLCSAILFAQNSHFRNHSYRPYDRYVYTSDSSFHTAIKPYNLAEVSQIVSLDTLYNKPLNSRFFNHIWNNNIFEYTAPADKFHFTINPAGNFETSREFGDTTQGWINSRGIVVEADIHNKIFLFTSFYEIQSKFRDYRYDRIREIGKNTIPGKSRAKSFKEDGFDYAFADAYITYVPSETFSFELGHGKHFIGDGYRSILLSDNAHSYPYFKVTTDIWNIKYTNMWSQRMYVDEPHLPNSRYPAKWNVMHYLDWAVTDWLQIGFFETIIWANKDTLGNHRGFEFNYINPVIFLRPVEFQIGSPDNVMMGLTGKLRLWKSHILYGQLLIDEFKIEEMRARNGYWGNKYAIQAGYKTYDIAGISHVDFQTEVNYVRPFMYSHFLESQQYGHALQPLAHPAGANFYESVSFLSYEYKRWFFRAKYQYLVSGQDTAGTNYGNDIFKLYQTRSAEYGNTIADLAIQKVVTYKNLEVSYMINPHNNMNVTLGLTQRKEYIQSNTDNEWMYYVAFRTTLNNFYYDF
ncbi:MAG: hypothetical protein R6U95_07070 [Bacteroidales bacterium]